MSSKDYIIVKDGEMVHFKYIKREKVNGEWRYYYDKGSIGRSIKKAVGIDARNAYRSARDAAVTAENAHKEAYAAKQKETAEAKATKAEAEAVRKENPAVSDKQLQRLQDFYVTATENVVNAKKELAAAQKAASNLQSTPAAALGSSLKNATTTALKDGGDSTAVKTAKEKLAKAEQLAAHAKSEYNNAFKASKGANKANAYEKAADKQAKEAAEANKKNAEAAKMSVEAQKSAQEALKKYYKTPLGSLKFLSDKGKELLYKIF